MAVETLSNGLEALIDDADVELIRTYRPWHASPDRQTTYARAFPTPSGIQMHRLILAPLPHETVDHINGNGLDNRRLNLRIVNLQQNAANRKKYPGKTSRYKGVVWSRHARQWRATIGVNRKSIHIGYFRAESDAAAAYDAAARRYFGEYALVNFEE